MNCLSAVPQVAFSAASSADALGADEDFTKSFDASAASARLSALRKSKAAYEAMLLKVVGETGNALVQEVDVAVKRVKGQINRAAMLQLLRSSAITHPARGKDMRKSLQSIYDALVKLGREHVREEVWNQAAEILGLDAGHGNAAADEARQFPGKLGAKPKRAKVVNLDADSAEPDSAEPAAKKQRSRGRQG
jgi:hypothetical protein